MEGLHAVGDRPARPAGSGAGEGQRDDRLRRGALLVSEPVAAAAASSLTARGRRELETRIAAGERELGVLEQKLAGALGEGALARWWHDRTVRLDPKLLDTPRGHLTRARQALGSDDLDAAQTSVDAFDDTAGIARSQLRAYETNDFSDPTREDPISLGGSVG